MPLRAPRDDILQPVRRFSDIDFEGDDGWARAEHSKIGRERPSRLPRSTPRAAQRSATAVRAEAYEGVGGPAAAA